MPIASDSFALMAAELELHPGELAPEQILDGCPSVRLRQLWTSEDRRQEAGVWEITPGVVTDVESDEVFVVIGGRARVQIDGGATLELTPGVVGSFSAGARTTWEVTETLRKVYSTTVG